MQEENSHTDMSDRPQISRGKALGLLFLGAVGISFSPTLVKAVGQNVVGPTAIAFWRTLIGGIALLVLTLLQGKRLTVSRRTFLWCTFTGFVFFLDLTFWHRSILYVGSGMATMLGNTQVFSTAVLSVFIFKEKITGRFIAAAVVALVGVTMLVGLWSESVVFSSSYLRGIVLGLLTGLMYALYMVGIKKAGADESMPEPIAVVTWLCLTAALFSGIGSIFEKGAFMPPDGRSVLWLVLLGVVVQALAWWLIAHVLRAIPIHLASLVLLSQPVLAIVWGYLIFAETLVPLQIAGAVITLAAIYAGSLKSKK